MSLQRDLTPGIAEVERGIRIHYVTDGDGPRPIVLLHGFPQTWWEWRHLIPELSGAGFRVLAPDYRGAGHSARPADGYAKRTMARDIQRLKHEHLEITEPAVLVGHDIGLMVAYAYAQRYRDDVSHLVVIDGLVPGTIVFDALRADPRLWHFSFHGARDVAEMLVAGRERSYLDYFFRTRTANPSAIGEADLDIYLAAYAAPGGMRAAFELYRAFDQDAAENRRALADQGRLAIPVLAVGGEMSTSGEFMYDMMRELADNVRGVRVPATGHWIPEESPAELLRLLIDFVAQ